VLAVGPARRGGRLAALEAEGKAFRGAVRCRLAPLSAAEVGLYLEHGWRAGSADPFPFPPAAVRRIARVSGRVPQEVNVLAGRLLQAPATRGAARFPAAMGDRVAGELMRGHPPRGVSRVPSAGAAAAVALFAIAATGLLLRPVTLGRDEPVEATTLSAVERSATPVAVPIAEVAPSG